MGGKHRGEHGLRRVYNYTTKQQVAEGEYYLIMRSFTRVVQKVLPHIFSPEYIDSKWLKFGDNIN
jgi:muramidase (phage lysozyme)